MNEFTSGISRSICGSFLDTGWICNSPLSSQLLLIIHKLPRRTYACAAISNPSIRFRNDHDQIHYDQASITLPANDGSSSLPRPVSETISQSTDVCPSCQMSKIRKRGRHAASCGLFYHNACARLKKVESSGLCTWICQRCLFHENASLSSSQPTTASSMYKYLPNK